MIVDSTDYIKKELQYQEFRRRVELEKRRLKKGDKKDDGDDSDDDKNDRKIPHFKTNVNGSIDILPQALLPSFPRLNPVWGTSKQEQVEETPQRMEDEVVINDFYKDIENVINKTKWTMSLLLENRELRMEFPITIRMNSSIYLIMTSLPPMITNDICSPEDFGTLINMNLCTR